MGDNTVELKALAQYLRGRREAILDCWRRAIVRDPALTAGDSLPRVQLLDHIPELLSSFELNLCNYAHDAAGGEQETGQKPAAAHGLQRWQQGYNLREVIRELGKLNECVVAELDAYTEADPPRISHAAQAAARRLWAAACGIVIEESVGQYFQLQQREAAGHVRDLESALAEIRALEEERAGMWQQAAHDLRGNLGVVANVTVGLTHTGLRESVRDEFTRILMRNITSLHHLLDDVTSLARLQAGREVRRIEPLDITPIIQQLCEGVRPLAQQRRLFLRCDGPPGFAADGDAVKIRRIAQNLVLNAVKYTQNGGITVRWGDSGPEDPKRWELFIQDTGPGFPTSSGKPLAGALATAGELQAVQPQTVRSGSSSLAADEPGEGIGLSIVKRLCEMLDATIDMKSVESVGTSFRILFPRKYSH